MSREREDTGRYTETVAPEDVLAVFERVTGPVVTSGDVAEALGCSRETARRKLRALEERGRVASRKTAGRVVWWRADARPDVALVDPDDPFFTRTTYEAGTSTDTSERVDEHLYG